MSGESKLSLYAEQQGPEIMMGVDFRRQRGRNIGFESSTGTQPAARITNKTDAVDQ